MTTGRRFCGTEAAAIGIVDATAGQDAVTATAIDMLTPLGGKDSGTLGAIKNTMFAAAVAALNS
jgi:enoyl-CoA hydratase/carnithine racemase